MMQTMDAKEYLKQLQCGMKKILNTGEYIQRLQESLDIIEDFKEEESTKKIYHDLSAQIADTEKEMQQMKVDFVKSKMKIMDEINQMDNLKHQQLLVNVYVYGMTLKETSEVMTLSYAYIRELHLKALKEFERMMES